MLCDVGRHQPGCRWGGRLPQHNGIGFCFEEGGPGRDFRGGPEINWDATVLIVNAKVGTGRNLSRNAKLRGRSQLSEPGARLGMFELRAGHWPCNHATLKCRRGRRAEVHDRASSEPADSTRGVLLSFWVSR